MTKTLGNYIVELVHKFYVNYAVTIENMTPFKMDKDTRKQPRLDTVFRKGTKIDVLEKAISIALFTDILSHYPRIVV